MHELSRRAAAASSAFRGSQAATMAPRAANCRPVVAPVFSASISRAVSQKPSVSAMSARSFATSEPRGVFELAAAIKAKETSTGDCIEAINGIQIRAVDSLGKERQALEIIESDALSALVELLRDSDTIAASALLVPAFLALIRLSTEPTVVQELVRLDAPLVVARFLTLSEPDPRLQIAACLTLGNIALEASAAAAVAVPEVVAAVHETVGSPHEAIQTAAVTCLSNIAGSTRGREQLLDPDTISTLSDLLQDDHCELSVH